MNFTEIFCYVDDFFQELDKHTNSITNHNNKSGPKSRLNRSEVITIIIGYWQSSYDCFKNYCSEANMNSSSKRFSISKL
ncbi:transposase, IS4 family protein [Rickettsia endosymbiont of Ixodes scapularis]|nr:transposase, IS4 family protein [Rickettsia endosymbiont of Ixodes scapularis]